MIEQELEEIRTHTKNKMVALVKKIWLLQNLNLGKCLDGKKE